MALLPPSFLNAVIAIGVSTSEQKYWIGTGFLFGSLDKPKATSQQKGYNLWLVTNKHVLSHKRSVCIRFNSADSSAIDYQVQLIAKNGRNRWVGHPNPEVDVAVMPINHNLLGQDNRQYSFFRSDTDSMSIKLMVEEGVAEGDAVFVLGFPLGLVSEDASYTICRGGVVAQVRNLLKCKTTDFLIDSQTFPGNSGGPVVLKPTVSAIGGTKAITSAKLIGVVKSYIPYVETAVSNQTQLPRVTFQENSGLTAVESVDSIQEAIAVAKKRIKARASAKKARKKT